MPVAWSSITYVVDDAEALRHLLKLLLEAYGMVELIAD
jgi:hypothetical protein